MAGQTRINGNLIDTGTDPEDIVSISAGDARYPKLDGPNTLSGDLTLNMTSDYLRIQDFNTEVVSGTNMGGVEWRTGDSNVSGANRITARIRAEGDGTFNATDKAPTKLVFSTHTTSGVDPIDRMEIGQDGDISFYEDTGTTPKFFWDASAEQLDVDGTLNVDSGTLFVDSANNRVGVGTSSPSFDLDITGTVKVSAEVFTGQYRLLDSGSIYRPVLSMDADNTVIETGTTSGARSILFKTEGSEAARINYNGRVGIGTSNPLQKLDVNGASLLDGVVVKSFSSGDTGISVNQGSGGGMALLLATSNFSAGTSTESGVYLIKFFHSGDNTPQLIHIAGNNFVSIGQSPNNTLVIDNESGNDSYAIIGLSLSI